MDKVINFIKNHKPIFIGIGGVVVLIIVVIIVLSLSKKISIGNNKDRLTKDLDTLGRKYYEEFYYQGVANSDAQEEKAQFLKYFSTVGMKVPLESLLQYVKDSNVDFDTEFKNNSKKQECDKKNTYVIIYPKSPYGVKDYDFELNLDCGFDN